MSDIVIYCPGSAHKEPRFHKDKKEKIAIPKILLLVSEGTTGKIKAQCNDGACKRSGGEHYNGWYEVEVKGYNNYSVKALKKQFFDLKLMPTVIMGDN